MKKIIKNISRFLFSLLLIVSIFGAFNVLAEEVIFKITNISVKGKSEKVTVNDVSLSGGAIVNDIVFSEKDDYITYNITFKNNTNDKYKILSITDDNDSEYLNYTYDDLSNTELNGGDEKTFNLTITYKKETNNLTITDKAVSLTLTYEKEDGTTGTETITNPDNNTTTGEVKGAAENITNPKTGDNVTTYIIIGIISLVGLTITTVSKKHLSKSLMAIALVSSIALPLGVKADTDKFIIKFNNNISKARSDGGLYDRNDNLVISYNDFVTATGWNVENTDYIYMIDEASGFEMCMNAITGTPETDMSLCSTSLLYILTKNIEYSNVRKIVLPEGITDIGNYSFASSKLTSIELPSTLTTIGDGAFSGSSIKNINIPNNVTTIGIGSFMGTNIPVINIPSSVTSIGYNAFGYTPVIIYNGSATDDSGTNWGAFHKNAYVDGDFAYTDQSKKELLIYIGDSSNVVVPDGVETIGTAAFSRCAYSNELIQDNSVNYRSCYNIRSIALPDSLTTIKKLAFYEANNIASITIPQNVNRIEEEIFYNFASLSLVVFENVNGWNANGIAISPDDLSSQTNAAYLIKNEHRNRVWSRTD